MDYTLCVTQNIQYVVFQNAGKVRLRTLLCHLRHVVELHSRTSDDKKPVGAAMIKLLI